MPKNFGVILSKYLQLNLKFMRLVRKTRKLANSVTILYIHLILVVDNPPKVVPFLTVLFNSSCHRMSWVSNMIE
jgi:hypothetical protein